MIRKDEPKFNEIVTKERLNARCALDPQYRSMILDREDCMKGRIVELTRKCEQLRTAYFTTKVLKWREEQTLKKKKAHLDQQILRRRYELFRVLMRTSMVKIQRIQRLANA